MEQGELLDDGEYSPTSAISLVQQNDSNIINNVEYNSFEDDFEEGEAEQDEFYNNHLERKKNGDIDRNRERERERDRDREREYQYRDNRDNRYKDSDNDRDRFKNRDRDRYGDRDRRDRYIDRREKKRYDDVSSVEPCKVIILRGLSYDTNEEKIKDSIKPYGIFESVSLKVDRQTNESRGFAFVNFASIDAAIEFMDNATNSHLAIDGKEIIINYSISTATNTPNTAPDSSQDWVCDNCYKVNFSWRKQCFNCNDPIPANPTLRSAADTNEDTVPATSLIIRDLDLNTTEDTINKVYYELCQVVPREIRLVKKPGQPKGIAFLEFNSLSESSTALDSSSNLIIDNQLVRINYVKSEKPAKNKLPTGISASDYVQWANSFGNNNTSNTSNNSKNKISTPEGCVIDPTTGFYYNSTSGYYFDVIEQVYFYYDTTKQGYLYYNTATKEYQPFTPKKPPVTHSSTSTTSTPSGDKPKEYEPAKKKPPGQKINASSAIKKMDSEIDKWNHKGKLLTEAMIADEKLYKAPITSLGIVEYTVQQHLLQQQQQAQQQSWSTVQQHFEVQDAQQQQTAPPAGASSPPPSAPIKFAMKLAAPVKVVAPVINKAAVLINQQVAEEINKPHPPPQQISKADMIICKLCDRQFPSYDALEKHEKMSKLHQTNLEKAQKEGADISALIGRPSQNKASAYKQEEEKKRKGNDPFGEHSIGYKLLKRAGWKDDESIGKNNAPIELSIRPAGAGLGSTNEDAKYAIQPGDDYHTITRKRAMQRFQSIGGNDIENNPFFKQNSNKKNL